MAASVCSKRIFRVLESLPTSCRTWWQNGVAISAGCWRRNTRDFISRRFTPWLSPSEASSVIPYKSHYNAPGGEGQPQGNACPDSSKTRYRKPFLGVCRRLTENRELRIAFFGIYAIFIKGTFRCFLRENEFLLPPIWQKFRHCIILHDLNCRVTENAEKTPLKTAKFSVLFYVSPANDW